MAKYDEDPFDYEDEEEEDFMTFDAREEGEGSGRGPYILLGIVLLLVVFGTILWAFLKGGNNPSNETPQIAANSEPFKETPIAPIDATNAVDAAANSVDMNAPPPLEVQAMGNGETPMISKNAVGAPVATTAPATKEAPPRPANAQAAAKPAPKPQAAPKAEAKPTPAKATTPSNPNGGAYAAQLGSFKEKSQADAAIAKYRKSGLTGPVSVVKADLGAKGVWYRVKATGFESRSQVTTFCSKAKSAGANCIPSK